MYDHVMMMRGWSEDATFRDPFFMLADSWLNGMTSVIMLEGALEALYSVFEDYSHVGIAVPKFLQVRSLDISRHRFEYTPIVLTSTHSHTTPME